MFHGELKKKSETCKFQNKSDILNKSYRETQWDGKIVIFLPNCMLQSHTMCIFSGTKGLFFVLVLFHLISRIQVAIMGRILTVFLVLLHYFLLLTIMNIEKKKKKS